MACTIIVPSSADLVPELQPNKCHRLHAAADENHSNWVFTGRSYIPKKMRKGGMSVTGWSTPTLYPPPRRPLSTCRLALALAHHPLRRQPAAESITSLRTPAHVEQSSRHCSEARRDADKFSSVGNISWQEVACVRVNNNLLLLRSQTDIAYYDWRQSTVEIRRLLGLKRPNLQILIALSSVNGKFT